MEFKARKMDLRVLLLPLLIIVTSLAACESDEILDPAEASGTVLIELQPSGLEAPWSLVTPMGDVIEGDGAASLKSMVIGDYALSWGEAAGYRTPDVARASLAKDATITLTGSYEPLSFGNVTIDVEPDATDAGWMLVSQDGELYEGNGDSTLTKLAAGDYTLGWIAVPGYEMPSENPVTFTLAADGDQTVQGVYTATARGSIAVDVTPDSIEASWSLGTETGELIPGTGDQTVSDLPLDTYTLTWGYVDGWDPPSPRQVEIVLDTDGQTESVSGTYTESDVTAPTGSVELVVSPSGLAAPWSLSGPDGFAETGTGAETLAGVPVGDYEVAWGDVSGYSAPASERGTLVEGETLTLEGNYESQLGRIEIRPEPSDEPNLPWALSGPGDFFRNGFGATDIEDVLAGEYTITWGDAPGFVTPPPETAVLNAGETLRFAAIFAVATGWITVDPSPDSIDAPWTLTPENGSPSSGNGDVSLEVEVGSYTLTWGEVVGWLRPDPSSETVEVVAGETVVIDGEYTEDSGGSSPATGTVEIDVTPNSASWSLAGPEGFAESGSGDAWFTDVAIGGYTVTWNALDGYATPSSATDTLQAGETISFRGTYGALGSPTIDDVNGSLSEGGTLTITGSNFGPKVPAEPLVWDTFENGTVGESPRDQQAVIGDWDSDQGAWNVTYTDARGYGGSSQAASHNWNREGLATYNASLIKKGISGSRPIVYVDYKSYVPHSPNGHANFKPWRFYGPERVSDGTSKTFRAGYMCHSSSIMHKGHPEYQDWGGKWESYGGLVDEWHHWQIGLQESSAPGVSDGFIKLYLNAQPYQWTEGTFAGELTDTKADGYTGNIDQAWIGHYMATDERAGCFIPEMFTSYTDNIYIDTTWARVEIGDEPIYDACSRREIQIPTHWSSGQIKVTANPGSFRPGEVVYVFVINENDTRSIGYGPTRVE